MKGSISTDNSYMLTPHGKINLNCVWSLRSMKLNCGTNYLAT